MDPHKSLLLELREKANRAKSEASLFNEAADLIESQERHIEKAAIRITFLNKLLNRKSR